MSALVPVGAGHETEMDLGGWFLSLAVALGLGLGLLGWSFYLAKKAGRLGAMRRREAMALVGGGWLVCGVVAALPYCFCEPRVSFNLAFFEAVSGLTTTGATIFVDLEEVPKSILMWRSFTQWFGGMGILAMFVLVLAGMTSSGKTLVGAESSLSTSDIASFRQTMRRLWGLYAGFTLVCGLGLWAMGLTPFQAVNHALATLSTGGFGTENASVGAEPFGVISKLWMMVFMLLGATTFPLYLSMMAGRWEVMRTRFEEVIWFYLFVGLGIGVVTLSHFFGEMRDIGWVDLAFNVVSAVTSTGFVSGDFGDWSRLGLGLLILLFVMGGCAGSTSGGLKVGRIVLWGRFLKVGLHRTFRPKMVVSLKMNGQVVRETGVGQLFAVLSFFGFFAFLGTFAVQVMEPEVSLLGAVSVVLSCLGNYGPAFAEMGEATSFVTVGWETRMLFVGLMLLGRLEYLAVLVLLSRQLWKRY